MSYIGSAVNVSNRWKRHKKDLKNGKHHSIHLQRAYNKYGINNFIFLILEEIVDNCDILSKEQYYLDKFKTFKRKNGYNINPIAGSNLGRKFNKSTREKQSAIRKGKTYEDIFGKNRANIMKNAASKRILGKNNPMFGKTHSETYKKYRSELWSNENNPKYGTGKKVLQYSLDGILLRQFVSVNAIFKELWPDKKISSQIRRCIKNNKPYNGFIFSYDVIQR